MSEENKWTLTGYSVSAIDGYNSLILFSNVDTNLSKSMLVSPLIQSAVIVNKLKLSEAKKLIIFDNIIFIEAEWERCDGIKATQSNAQLCSVKYGGFNKKSKSISHIFSFDFAKI